VHTKEGSWCSVPLGEFDLTPSAFFDWITAIEHVAAVQPKKLSKRKKVEVLRAK